MPGKAIVVRDAADHDREAIEAVLLEAYSQYELLLPAERWEQYKIDIVKATTSAAVKARLVAELDGAIVGSVFLYASSEAAYGLPELSINTPIMRLLAVAKGARGRGVATELIRASVSRSRHWGADTLHLHTTDLMESAIRLYERLGFERATDKDLIKGDSVVKSYRLHLKEEEYRWAIGNR
ncbi:GNAT family N-acetyltransferase [Paenibacillus oenotherae]|uniref:GNAT family N-acetyltransferase n=1 Tax=Paenibacillus oenotherae TaxID=1435645 RepID=A0ABS7D658_9BACL|nr:GNAT family N-acetyltransferase [Paenibacillus oenotherae]MBW7475351.1 GNAT family N-acetyltransferase [Paenibacillus oenotherae]